jgi:alkaline phosphatase D
VMFPISTPEINRRSFLRASGSLAAAAFFSACATPATARRHSWSGYPFSLGVASGDPAADGFVLWTRLAPDPINGGGMPPVAVSVAWEVAQDEQFAKVVRRGFASARPEWGHSVHVEIAGLQPERWYWYRFRVGNETSPVGRTRTMPQAGVVPEKFRFAFASCQHFETGHFTAYRHMREDNPDLVIHLGDYIYEGAGRDGGVRKHIGPELMTLEDYRNRLAQYRTDPELQAMHGAAPWLVTWDDHEVDNNYANDLSEEAHVTPAQLLARRAVAYQAYYEHMPLRRASLPHGPHMKLYRKISVGHLADFFVLDTRQYRTDQPCKDGNKPPCAEVYDPNATLLGAQQREWLQAGLRTSPATWKVLAQQVMMARVDRLAGEQIGFSMDQWPGYEFERARLLHFFHQHRIQNPVVLTGDIHTNWANELTLPSDYEFKYPVAAEFVGTSITSGGDGNPNPNNRATLLSENPMVKFYNAQRGYVRCDLSSGQWKTDYRIVPFVTREGAPVQTAGTFLLNNGSSLLHPA